MSLKCCLSVAYYRRTLFYEARYSFYICLYVFVLVFICLIYVIYFAIIIFILITINHIISLKQVNSFFGYVCQKFSLRMLLSFCLIFSQFQPDVPYKSVAYKKACSIRKNIYCSKLILLQSFCCLEWSLLLAGVLHLQLLYYSNA